MGVGINIQTKVSTKFRRETNPSKYHSQVPAPGPIFFQWQGMGPGRTWRSAATGSAKHRFEFPYDFYLVADLECFLVPHEDPPIDSVYVPLGFCG